MSPVHKENFWESCWAKNKTLLIIPTNGPVLALLCAQRTRIQLFGVFVLWVVRECSSSQHGSLFPNCLAFLAHMKVRSRMLQFKRPRHLWATVHHHHHISPHNWGSRWVKESASTVYLRLQGRKKTESHPISELVNIDIGFTSLISGLLCNYNWSPLCWSSCTAWITLVVSSTAAPGTGNTNVSILNAGRRTRGILMPKFTHLLLHSNVAAHQRIDNE